MKLPFLISLFTVPAINLLHAEKTPEEWQEELGQVYSKMGSFVASYSGESPGKPPLRIFRIEDRKRNSALITVSLGNDKQTMWLIPGEGKDAGFYMHSRGATTRIVDFMQVLMARGKVGDAVREELKKETHAERPDQKEGASPQFLTSSYLTEEGRIESNIYYATWNKVPWLEDQTIRQVDEVVVKENQVEFFLANGQRLVGDRRNGLLLEQEIPVPEGVKWLRLDGVQPLPDGGVLRQEIPKIDPEAITEHHLHQAQPDFWLLIAASLTYHLAEIPDEENRKQLQESTRDSMVTFWKTFWTEERIAGLLNPNVFKEIKTNFLAPSLAAYKRDHPSTAKDLTLRDFVTLKRTSLRTELATKNRDQWEKSDLSQLLAIKFDRFADRLPANQKKAANEVYSFFQQTIFEAMWDVALGKIIEEL